MSGASVRLVRALAALAVAAALTLSACAGHATKPLSDLAAMPSGGAVFHPEPQLFTAGQPATNDWRAFADAGVHTVINLRTPGEMQGRDERAEVEAAGLRYLALPVDGAASVNPQNAQRLTTLLAEASGPVLLHCHSGNRAGGLLALARAQAGMPAADALELGRRAGMKSTEAPVRAALGLPALPSPSPSH